jgi:hypothetical protein
MKKEDEIKEKKGLRSPGLSKFVRFSGMGLQMGVTIWVASLIGGWLDGKYPSDYISYFKVLTLLAVFGTMYSFIRQVIELGKSEDKNESNKQKSDD